MYTVLAKELLVKLGRVGRGVLGKLLLSSKDR